jgi:hypothetical protein
MAKLKIIPESSKTTQVSDIFAELNLHKNNVSILQETIKDLQKKVKLSFYLNVIFVIFITSKFLFNF